MSEKNGTSLVTDLVCAVVVAYCPDHGFYERLQTLLHQVGKVVVIDNTPDDRATPRLKITLQDVTKILCIDNRANLGIAAALNQGLTHASKAGYEWMLALDQDTQCHPDMVDTLLSVSNACHPKPAVVGGNYFDPQNDQTKVPTSQGAAFLEQKTVITSGSLIDVRSALAIGGFREDYFIDQVDHEFCLRARVHGHRVIISCKPVMAHSVGRLGGVRIPFFGVMPNHPPLRKYYIARNTVIIISEYWRHDPQWCLRRFVRLILGLGHMAILEKNRLTKVRAFVAGVTDGAFNRLGPCRRAWLIQIE